MNRFVVLAIAGCIASAALSAPANAAPIVIDPTIGVRGGGASSPVTDGSANILRRCDSLDFADTAGVDLTGIESFFCAAYEFTSGNTETFGPEITSFDLAFWDNNGTPIPVCLGEFCATLNFSASAQSQFGSVSPVGPSNYVVRLAVSCPEEDCAPGLLPGHLLLFVEQPEFNLGFVSIQAVNGISEFQDPTNLATPGQSISPVPEPASLVLFGTGVVGMVARRRLRRKGER